MLTDSVCLRDHMVNLVTLSSQRYLVDVGMGARGPTVPLVLLSDTSVVSISPRKMRLLHGSIPEHTYSHPSNAMWRLEVCDQEDSPWIPVYAFTEVEFLPVDFEMMNWYTSCHRRSWFTHKLLVSLMLLDEQRENVIGDITLYETTFRKRIHGTVDVEVKCKSEKERVALLFVYFGIRLTDIEQRTIRGTMSEIP